MFCNLNELNQTINQVVDELVRIGTDYTSNGNYIADYDDVKNLISYEDYLGFFNLIEGEISERPEILEVDACDEQFDMIFGLAYCPNYEWMDGDETVFGCSYEEWLEKPTLPISQKSNVNIKQ